MGLRRVGHDWATNTHTHTHTQHWPKVFVSQIEAGEVPVLLRWVLWKIELCSGDRQPEKKQERGRAQAQAGFWGLHESWPWSGEQDEKVAMQRRCNQLWFFSFLSLFFCSAQLELLPVPIATSCLLIPQALGPEYDKYQFSTGAKITLPKEWGNHPENKILFVWIVPLEMFWQTGSSGDYRASAEPGSCLNYLHNCLPSLVCPGRRDLANHQLA